MIKVAWLSQYNVFNLLPEIKLTRQVVLHNSSWIFTLSQELALQKGIELHIITHSHLVPHSQVIKKDGITYHVIKYSFPFTSKGFPWYMPIDKLTSYYSFSKEAEKIIGEIKPDVLHVHGTEGGYNIPAIKTKIPFITSIQGIIIEYLKVTPNISMFFQLFYERAAIKSGKYFGCRTNFDFDFVRKNNKNAVIYDLPEAMNKVFFEKQWKPDSEISILFVGSVMKRKGIEDLIHALNKLKATFPAIKLKIIGGGYLKYIKFLNQLIEKYNLENNVSWLGARTPSEIATELSRSTLFVLPTLMDNSPNCLAEAMAVGVPSIATNVGGIPSMVDHKYDGMLFEKHDIDGLVETVKLLLADEPLQTKLSVNARKRAFGRYFPLEVAKKYISVYESLINGGA